jgi:hypothetical protein
MADEGGQYKGGAAPLAEGGETAIWNLPLPQGPAMAELCGVGPVQVFEIKG